MVKAALAEVQSQSQESVSESESETETETDIRVVIESQNAIDLVVLQLQKALISMTLQHVSSTAI